MFFNYFKFNGFRNGIFDSIDYTDMFRDYVCRILSMQDSNLRFEQTGVAKCSNLVQILSMSGAEGRI